MQFVPGLRICFLCLALATALSCSSNSAVHSSQAQLPTITLTAQPPSINSGSSSVLSWQSTNATSVTIAGLGTFAATGSAHVAPASTTTFLATATGPGGTVTSSIVITVVAGSPQPSITLTAQPATIASGASSLLSWSATNATSVEISGLGVLGTNGSTTVSPTSTTTYVATAVGAQGATATSSTTVIVTSGSPAVPQFGHVVIVLEENHSYSSVIGSSSAPFVNSLAHQYGLATQYYANTHPSIGNYFMLTTGQIITNDDAYTGTVMADNIVRHLLTAGKTWKAYAESLPSVGYTGPDLYPYAKRHNPLAFFSDVVNSQTEASNLVPFTEFATDLGNDQLPVFSFIVPNLLHDAHDGSLQQADTWLQQNIAPLISSVTFQKDGLLIIVFDESYNLDLTHGGGHVACVIVSPRAKPGYQSTTFFQHESSLRLMMEGMGITLYPGAAATAPSMAEFF
jgi:phosphatidylinositol-3-phosphatase